MEVNVLSTLVKGKKAPTLQNLYNYLSNCILKSSLPGFIWNIFLFTMNTVRDCAMTQYLMR